MGLSQLYEDLLPGEQFNIRDKEDQKLAFLVHAYILIEALGGQPPSGEAIARMNENDVLDMVSDMLFEFAPENHYFGENQHENGVFGFWPVPDMSEGVR